MSYILLQYPICTLWWETSLQSNHQSNKPSAPNFPTTLVTIFNICIAKRGSGVITDIVVKQTEQAGCWLTVDIQTSFHSFLLLRVHLKVESKWTQVLEVALIQSSHCADWHSKHLRVRISGCPPLDKSETEVR